MVCAPFGFTQSPPETTTIVLVRYGERFASQNTASMHYLEGFQIRNRWVLPDIGYINFGHSDYREVFMGGGYTLLNGRHLTLVEEGLFVQASGAAAKEARYVMPWTMLEYRITDTIGGEAVYFPYIPINDSGRKLHVLERAKLERKFTSR